VKLFAYAYKGCLDIEADSGIVHQVVRVKTVSEDREAFYRHYIACGIKLADVPTNFVDMTPNCLACLAQTVYRVKCRRGACGKWQHPEAMGIHRDTLEAYCVECAAHITQANKDGTLVQMWALLEQEK
jgi:hypothetical protein